MRKNVNLILSVLTAACLATATSAVAADAASGPGGADSGSTQSKTLFDFENGKPGPFTGGKITTQSIEGKYSLEAVSQPLQAAAPQDWSGYDLLKIDVMNPKAAPVMLAVELRDTQTKGYWTRVNYSTIVPPGKSTVTLRTDQYVGEKARPGRPLIKGKVNFMALSPSSYPLTFDNIRLERFNTDAVKFDGLKAFDFGPKASPVMPGYTSVATESYGKERGYGWLPNRNGYEKASDGLQPDELFEDFVATNDGSFRVDVPNGKYHVLMNIDSPGGFWGEVQAYSHREVSANGKQVVSEKVTFEDFLQRYFRNAHREDFPGVDAFHAYVQPAFNVKQFDVDVTDGKAVFQMTGDGQWPIALSALVMYPADKEAAGKKFWDWTTAMRREQFEEYFKQQAVTPTGAAAPATGYRIFSRNFMKTPNAADGPRQGEEITPAGLSATLAGDEEGALAFSVQPSGEMGPIAVKISDLKLTGNSASAAVLNGNAVREGWIDYRITRVTTDGAVYRVAPRYWHEGDAPAAGKFTRTFYLRIKPPAGTAAGVYQGQITVKPANQSATMIPLKITVLPFTLDPITDVAVGPFSCTIGLPWAIPNPKAAAWRSEMMAKSFAVIHAAGCTSLTGLPHIKMHAANGKVTMDFAQADREMKALRAAGFNQMIDSYGVGLGYQMYGNAKGPDIAAAKKAGFADMDAFLRAVYGQIEEHAKANDWLPIAWNLCDEPLGEMAKGSALNAEAHAKVAKELNLRYSLFSGATSMTGNDPKNDHYKLVNALQMPSLNLHDAAVIKMIHDDHHDFSFYNGGNRWTFGRYMKALVVNDGLKDRSTWHFNAAAGDPYYALDTREDDYCWYNTDANQTMVPAVNFLQQIIPGLNDYRYLSTLQRLITQKSGAAGIGEAKKVFDEQVNLVPGKDRAEPKPDAFDADRAVVVKAILSLVDAK